MTEGEICRDYQMAKNPVAQIKILAELNCISTNEVRDILTKHGIAVPKKKRWRDWSENNEKELERMYADGVSISDIARHFGLRHQAISDKISRLNLARR